MPWFITAFLLSIVFIVWGLIMAGTVALLQLVGIPYILSLPVAAIMPLILLFFGIVTSDTLFASDRRPYEN